MTVAVAQSSMAVAAWQQHKEHGSSSLAVGMLLASAWSQKVIEQQPSGLCSLRPQGVGRSGGVRLTTHVQMHIEMIPGGLEGQKNEMCLLDE